MALRPEVPDSALVTIDRETREALQTALGFLILADALQESVLLCNLIYRVDERLNQRL